MFAAGFLYASRADKVGEFLWLMPRDENEAKGIAAYFGLNPSDVQENLTLLGVQVVTLRKLKASRQRAA